MPLKKELSLFSTTLYGIGIILGAGIYALIGLGAGLAGNMLWLAFLLAALIAIFSGLSYAELSGIFPKEAAEYVYTQNAFHKEILSFWVGWILVIAGTVSAALVALAFGGYLSYLIGGSSVFYAVILIAIMSFLNYAGIKESANFNNISTLIELSGLILIIFLAFFFNSNPVPVNFFELPSTGFAGIFSAIGVIYFAFIGFENVANISEEVKDNTRVVPKAIIFSLIISAILYVLVSISVLLLTSASSLASSSAPLALAASKVVPDIGFLLSLIALFATANTVLIILVSTSRILYGISFQNSLPKIFSKLSSRETPYVSVLFAGLLAILIAFYNNLNSIAQITDLSIFIAYFFVNLALIKLRFSKNLTRTFTSPSIFNIPILAVFGALSSVFMFFYFDFLTWQIELAIILTGLIVFFVYKKIRK